ncbi:TPA: hypothetical protein OTX98_003352 [Klebsiella aerogenes]|nr:hypothetical protein [Klebsiella aerogenes]
MTDITRLLASLKRRAAHAKEFGHDVLFVKLEDIDALVEALELKEEQRANWFQMAQKLGDDLDVAEKRIAELESRTVTVKLVDINEFLADVHDKTLALAFRRLAEGVREADIAALTAQGIKWEAE